MQVTVVLEYRFDRTSDGHVRTSSAFPYEFWLRCLDVFDGVTVAARVQEIGLASGSHKRVDGSGVEICAIPYYLGPARFAKIAPKGMRAQ